MVIRGAEKKPYTLLDGVIPLGDDREVLDRMLGLVTENLARPLSGCRPEAPVKPRNLIEKQLYPPYAVECEDVSLFTRDAVEESARGEFSKILNLWRDQREHEVNDASAILLRQIEIQENPRERIKELLQVPEYEEGVRDLMRCHSGPGKSSTLAVIAGFITCTNMMVRNDAGKTSEMGASANIVSEASTGMPGMNAVVAGSKKRFRQRTITGTYRGEAVVACYYLRIDGSVDEPRSTMSSVSNWLRSSPIPSSLRVSEDPLTIHGPDGISAAYHIGKRAHRGDIRRPFGSGVKTPSELDNSERVSSSSGDPDDLDIVVGFVTPEDGDEFDYDS